MKLSRLIYSSLWHYRQRNLTVALGMAIGMAVITGALVTGDSVKSGLKNLVGIRLGNVDLAVTAGDRYVTDSLSIRMSAGLGIPAASVLQLGGSATAGGGTIRVPKVQVYGVDRLLPGVLGASAFEPPVNDHEAVISDNLASRLNVREGDEILIRINKPGPVPIDAPFVSDEENILTASVIVKSVAGKELHGRFNLQNTQSAPFNVFISKTWIQELAGMEGLSNLILMAGAEHVTHQEALVSLATSRTLTDAGLQLDKHPVTGEWILRTPRVFFDLPALQAAEAIPAKKSLWFSYFVNEFRMGNRSTPYSFVSTLPGDQVKPGEIIINSWLADDLGSKTGDSVTLSYFMVGPLRNLTVEKARFRITGIIPMDDSRCDRLLMPEIPGLSDAGNCRDWETSIPIELEKIRDKDEQYWKEFRGTPKAFIHPGEAAGMWQNRFGKYTQIRFEPGANPIDIGNGILTRLLPAETGLTVQEPALEGIAAASSGVDFSGLFLGLSFFLIAGGIIITILLIRLRLESRLSQIGTLRAMGWPEKQIRRMLLVENSWVAFIGALIGLILTLVYTILIFRALNGVWNDIVLTDVLEPVFRPATLVLGLIISIVVSTGSAWLAINRFFRRQTVELLKYRQRSGSPLVKKSLLAISLVAGIGSVGMLIYGLSRLESLSPTFFFSAGTLMLLSLILLAVRIFRFPNPLTPDKFNLGTLGRSNLRRNSSRSLSVILLFAIGVFMVVAIGANKKEVKRLEVKRLEVRGLEESHGSGTGGFLFYMETTVPIPDDLNTPEVRAKYGLDTPMEFVQMKKLEGDDASCLNLNRVSNPPLLGVSAGALTGRFKFSSLAKKDYPADPWKILESGLPGGAIPAVADQTVIQWGLGLKIGDTLKYKSEKGDTLKLVLVGGLSNSIFQGNILISESRFMQHWPSVSGTHISLISAYPSDAELVKADIQRVFRDYGADLKPAALKLAEFNSVENTYLSIFLVMGALAMLLGTIGLGIILTRNLQERSAEIALLRATGFSKQRILWLIVIEYSVLLFSGTLAGGIPALVSVLPGLLSPTSEVSPVFLVSILIILLAHGLAWVVGLGWYSVSKPGIIQSLRKE